MGSAITHRWAKTRSCYLFKGHYASSAKSTVFSFSMRHCSQNMGTLLQVRDQRTLQTISYQQKVCSKRSGDDFLVRGLFLRLSRNIYCRPRGRRWNCYKWSYSDIVFEQLKNKLQEKNPRLTLKNSLLSSQKSSSLVVCSCVRELDGVRIPTYLTFPLLSRFCSVRLLSSQEGDLIRGWKFRHKCSFLWVWTDPLNRKVSTNCSHVGAIKYFSWPIRLFGFANISERIIFWELRITQNMFIFLFGFEISMSDVIYYLSV